MSFLHKQFKTSKKKEREGITIEYRDDENPDAVPVRFVVARAGGANVAYNKVLDRETKPLRRAIAAGTVSASTLTKVTQKAFVEACLLGWENVPDEATGKPIPFSKEAATAYLEDLPDLLADLQAQASGAQLFLEDAEADAGN